MSGAESGERGTRVHGHVEAFLTGKSIDCLPSDMGYVDAIEKFMAGSQPLPDRDGSDCLVSREGTEGGST